jgi:hypothetical protein
MATVRILERRNSQDCGCPEEHIEIHGFAEAILHMEPDGSGEAFIDFGDTQEEKEFQCTDIDDLRRKVVDYITSLEMVD